MSISFFQIGKNFLLLALFIVFLSSSVHAAITFQDDTFHDIPSESVLLDSDGAGALNTSIFFGNDVSSAQNGVVEWDITNDEFRLTNGAGGTDRVNLSFEIETVSVLPGGAGGLGVPGAGRLVILDTPDSTAPGCTVNPFCSAGTYIWDGGAWISLVGSATSTNLTKVVTVDPGGGSDYIDIATAAAYLQTRSGGIMLLSADVHTVVTSVNLTNVIMIGKDASRTTVSITGAGKLNTFDTTFEYLKIDVGVITATMGLDVQTGSNSLIFNFVDFVIQTAGKSLIDSTAGVAPTVVLKLIKSNIATGNNGAILKTIASGNLNASSSIFIDSRSSDIPLQLSDWPVTLVGGGSVNTSGTITSVPGLTIYVSVGMNIQGAIDSLVVSGLGGTIILLPGTYSISSTLLINDSDIRIEGFGDSSVISASGFTGGSTVAAIQVGLANGSAPVNGVLLRDFRLEVTGAGASDIHGIRIVGGEDNRIDNVTVIKISGASGTAATARIGIQMIDGVVGCVGTCVLTRPVIIKSRVFGNGATNYFTDGIHVTSDTSYPGVFGNNQGVINALVDGNSVDYVKETAYVFVGPTSSSLFNNRASRMAAGGGGYGIFMANVQNINMTANVFSGSQSVTAIAIGIESFDTGVLKQTIDSIFTNNVIDGFGNSGVGFATGFQIGNIANTLVNRNSFQNNVIKGSVVGTSVAIDVRGNADDNTFSLNAISGGPNPWDIGVNLQSVAQDRNQILSNRDNNVTVSIVDGGTSTLIGEDIHKGAVNPTVNDDSADGYRIGTTWVNTTTNSSYILVDDTVASAVWKQIDVSATNPILDDTYNNDAGERTVLVDAGSVSWDISGANQFIVDLQGTGDFVVQDLGVVFATFSDTGDFDLSNNMTVGSNVETISNTGFLLNGDDVFVADSLGVEGQIYSDAYTEKYEWLDIFGGVRTSAAGGSVAGGNSPVIRFDATTNSRIRWAWSVPQDMDTTQAVSVDVFWSPAIGTAGGEQIELMWRYAGWASGNTISATEFTGNEIQTIVPVPTVTLQLVQTTFTILANSLNPGEMVNIRISRENPSTNVDDTYLDDINIHMLRIRYKGKALL